MKIKDGYILKKVVGASIVVPINEEANVIHTLNETGELLWSLLEEGAEREEMAARMTEEYDVSEERALKDIDLFIAKLRERGVIE
ncbi:MAG: PqqD family protein [Clostridia bacterium]|nr:PqqD family protein [Clostridia bacterium]